MKKTKKNFLVQGVWTELSEQSENHRYRETWNLEMNGNTWFINSLKLDTVTNTPYISEAAPTEVYFHRSAGSLLHITLTQADRAAAVWNVTRLGGRRKWRTAESRPSNSMYWLRITHVISPHVSLAKKVYLFTYIYISTYI